MDLKDLGEFSKRGGIILVDGEELNQHDIRAMLSFLKAWRDGFAYIEKGENSVNLVSVTAKREQSTDKEPAPKLQPLPAGSNAIGAILDGFPDSIVAKNHTGETIPAGTEVICQLISSRDKPGDPPDDPAPESWRDRPPLL